MVFNGVIFPNHQTNNNSIKTLKLGQIQVRNFSVSGGNARTSVAWIEIIVKLSCAKEDSGNSGLELGKGSKIKLIIFAKGYPPPPFAENSSFFSNNLEKNQNH